MQIVGPIQDPLKQAQQLGGLKEPLSHSDVDKFASNNNKGVGLGELSVQFGKTGPGLG